MRVRDAEDWGVCWVGRGRLVRLPRIFDAGTAGPVKEEYDKGGYEVSVAFSGPASGWDFD